MIPEFFNLLIKMCAINLHIFVSFVHDAELDVHLHLGKYFSILSLIPKPLFFLQFRHVVLHFKDSLSNQIQTDLNFLQQNKNNTAKMILLFL